MILIKHLGKMPTGHIRKDTGKVRVDNRSLVACDNCGTEWEIKTSRYNTHPEQLCKVCSRKTVTTDIFIERSKAKFGNKFSYDNTKYVDSKTDIIITCKVHGDFTQRPSDHLAKDGGCTECAKKSRNEKLTLTLEEWEERLHTKRPDMRIVSYNKLGYHENVVIYCPIHGSIGTKFSTLYTSSNPCLKCKGIIHQKQSIRKSMQGKKVKLYYVYIPRIDMWKFGITSKNFSCSIAGEEVKTIKEWETTQELGSEIEHEVFVALSEFTYRGSTKLLRNGNTELLKLDCLNQIKNIVEVRL